MRASVSGCAEPVALELRALSSQSTRVDKLFDKLSVHMSYNLYLRLILLPLCTVDCSCATRRRSAPSARQARTDDTAAIPARLPSVLFAL